MIVDFLVLAVIKKVMAINKEGNVAHVAFPIFSAFRKSAAAVYKDMIRTLIEKMMPRNLIRAKALPSTARVTLTGNDSYKLLHVKVTYPEIRAKLGVVEEHNVLPSGREIAVRGEFSEVVRLPDNLKLNSYVKDGYTYLTLPEIVGYDMFCLK